MNIDELLNYQTFYSENVFTLISLVNLSICIIMSFILRYFYVTFSYSLTGKQHIGSIIPILSTVVFLVIMVVKSSLALSLGLVGALSIVRFRTPIKEPEELVYLFLSIAIGLGYGAGQTLITTFVTVIILLIIYIWLSNKNNKVEEFNLILDWKNNKIDIEEIFKSIDKYFLSIKLVRYDINKSNSHVVILINPKNKNFISELSNDLFKIDPEIEISYFEANTNW